MRLLVGLRHHTVGSVQRDPLLWLLGLGAFGLSFSISTTGTFMPALLHRFTDSNTLIGLIVAAEGVFALTVPLVIGPWSDSFLTPLGRRRPFMLAALPALGFCLALVAFMPNIWTVGLIIAAFYAAYYVYEPPYRGLYPDLLPEAKYAKSQSVQHLMRGLAIGIPFITGPTLVKHWLPGPFVLAAVATTLACGAVVLWTREDGGHERVFRGMRVYVKASWSIFRSAPNVRMFLTANAAWEGTFAAVRTFVLLYITVGLRESESTLRWVLVTVTIGYIVAAVLASRVGPRLGLARTILYASCVYGVGLLGAGFPTNWHDWYYPIILVVAIAGGMVMTLSWALLFKIMPPEHRGAISGIATTTKGWGILIGPLVAGGLIDIFRPWFEKTDGYQMLWPVVAAPILLAIPLVASLVRIEESRDGKEPDADVRPETV